MSGKPLDASGARIALKLGEMGMSRARVAEACETSLSTLQRVKAHASDHDGAVREVRQGSGKKHDVRWHFAGPGSTTNLLRLDQLVQRMDASSTHEEIYAEYVKICAEPIPEPSTVSEALRKHLDYTTKRLSAHAPERNAARCDRWHKMVSRRYKRKHLVCIDEVGANAKAANRNRGLSKRGRPAVTHLNALAGGRKYSALGVFSEDGFLDFDVVDNAFNTDSFLEAVERSVLKHMQPYPAPRSVLLVDNCRIHSVHELVGRVRARGGRVVFLEPYDPMHMPIEVGFRAVKRWLRKNRSSLVDRSVPDQLRKAARFVSREEAQQAYAASGF